MRSAALVAIASMVVESTRRHNDSLQELPEDGSRPASTVESATPRGDVVPFPACSAKVFMQLCSVVEHGLWDSVAVVRATIMTCVRMRLFGSVA